METTMSCMASIVFMKARKASIGFDYVVCLTLPPGTGEAWFNCYLTKDTDLVGSCKGKVEEKRKN